MSASGGCRVKAHMPMWRVTVYRANYSAFNGYQYTPSDYSEVVCEHPEHVTQSGPMGGTVWRTKAAYVDTLPGRRNPA